MLQLGGEVQEESLAWLREQTEGKHTAVQACKMILNENALADALKAIACSNTGASANHRLDGVEVMFLVGNKASNISTVETALVSSASLVSTRSTRVEAIDTIDRLWNADASSRKPILECKQLIVALQVCLAEHIAKVRIRAIQPVVILAADTRSKPLTYALLAELPQLLGARSDELRKAVADALSNTDITNAWAECISDVWVAVETLFDKGTVPSRIEAANLLVQGVQTQDYMYGLDKAILFLNSLLSSDIVSVQKQGVETIKIFWMINERIRARLGASKETLQTLQRRFEPFDQIDNDFYVAYWSATVLLCVTRGEQSSAIERRAALDTLLNGTAFNESQRVEVCVEALVWLRDEDSTLSRAIVEHTDTWNKLFSAA
jgi:hypothetical protein